MVVVVALTVRKGRAVVFGKQGCWGKQGGIKPRPYHRQARVGRGNAVAMAGSGGIRECTHTKRLQLESMRASRQGGNSL